MSYCRCIGVLLWCIVSVVDSRSPSRALFLWILLIETNIGLRQSFKANTTQERRFCWHSAPQVVAVALIKAAPALSLLLPSPLPLLGHSAMGLDLSQLQGVSHSSSASQTGFTDQPARRGASRRRPAWAETSTRRCTCVIIPV